jgi:hypothetical protein
MGRPRQPQVCCSSVCLRVIHPDESGVVITCFAQTMGMGKRRTSRSACLYLCPQCANRTVSGKEPPKTAPFDIQIFKILLDLVGGAPDVAHEAWKQLQQRRDAVLSHALTEGEVLPPTKRLTAAS